MRGKIAFRFLPLPLALHDRLGTRQLDAVEIIFLSVAVRDADEEGKVRMSRREWATRTRLCPRTVVNVIRRLAGAGYLVLVQEGGPGRGPATYSLRPTLALLEGDEGAAIRAAFSGTGRSDGASGAPPDESADGARDAPLHGARDAPSHGARRAPPLIDRSIRQGDREMKNKKTEGEDGRQKTTAAGARATAPPSQNEEQDEEDDDVESSNDGLGRRESREQLAPGGLRRLNRHVNRYLDLLRQVRGIANATVTGKDKGVFRSWLQDQPDDEAVRKVLDGFVRDDDPFVRRNGWSLALLPRRANGYLAIDLGSASPAGPAGDSRGGVQPETDERIRILREAFSKAWSEKYRRPRVEGTERSETKAALKAISHYDAAGESEPFDRWAARIARAYMDIEDEYIVRSAHAFPLLPCRLDRICAAPATPRRERGVREQDWADTDDAGRQEEEVH